MLSVLLFGRLSVHAAPAPQPFQSGDRWCVLGDSITAGGYYHRYIEVFYLTRFPELKVEVINCGISGDTVSGALKRLQWDCLAAKPTVVSVMLGMNDVGWNAPGYPEEKLRQWRAARTAKYDQEMRDLTGALVAAGVKVILLTPSIFDDTADLPRKKCTGGGAALRVFSDRVKAIANEFNLPLVDFNETMTVINANRQKDDPHFTIVGPDRVHPGNVGHFVMAYEFLKTQGLAGIVSHIEIDAAVGTTDVQKNCTVTELKIQPREISFVCSENALPFPVEAKAEPALTLVPFMQEFNQEILRVRGLVPGDYELDIDGKSVRTWTAAQLAAGVNLAGESNAPQLRQALAVMNTLRQKWQAENLLRSVAFLEHNVWPGARPPDDLTQRNTELEAGLQRIAGANQEWAARLRANYLNGKQNEEKLRGQMAAALETARQLAVPKPHKFRLHRVNASGTMEKDE
jgi:lysophospholipase L1-like esterase